MAAETSVPSAPYRLDTPLSFVSRRQRPCVWHAGYGCREATSERSIDSKHGRPVTIIPLTVGLLSGGRVSLGFSEVKKFLSRDQEKNQDSLTSLTDIPST